MEFCLVLWICEICGYFFIFYVFLVNWQLCLLWLGFDLILTLVANLVTTLATYMSF